MKRQMFLISFGIGLFAVLTNLESVVGFLGAAVALVSPVVFGGLLAFILNVPMRGIEKRLNTVFASKRAGNDQIIRISSLFLTLLSLLLVIALVLVQLRPIRPWSQAILA